MDQIGQMLREARERQGITYEQVEEDIMIKKRYLEAMENEEWSKLPGKVYAKGFLRSYARYLKLNEQSVIDLFELSTMEEKVQKEKVSVPQAPQEPKKSNIELNNKPKKNMIIIFCIVSILLLFGSQWVYNNIWNPGKQGENNLPGEVPQVTDNEPPEKPDNTQVPEPVEETPQPPKNSIDLIVLAQEEPCWLRIRDGQKQLYEGTLAPGQKVEFTDIKELNIRAGNAGAIQITINGEVIEPIGNFSEVVTKTFVVENGVLKLIE